MNPNAFPCYISNKGATSIFDPTNVKIMKPKQNKSVLSKMLQDDRPILKSMQKPASNRPISQILGTVAPNRPKSILSQISHRKQVGKSKLNVSVVIGTIEGQNRGKLSKILGNSVKDTNPVNDVIGTIDPNRPQSKLSSLLGTVNEARQMEIDSPPKPELMIRHHQRQIEPMMKIVEIAQFFDQAELTILLRQYTSITRVVISKKLSIVQVEFRDEQESLNFLSRFNGRYITELSEFAKDVERVKGGNRFDRLIGAGSGVAQKVIEFQ